MQILITVPVDALFDAIWGLKNLLPFGVPGKREEFDRAESAWAYYHKLIESIRTEYPRTSLRIDLDWATPCEREGIEVDVLIMPGEKEDRTKVLERVGWIENDVWEAYPTWLVRVTGLPPLGCERR